MIQQQREKHIERHYKLLQKYTKQKEYAVSNEHKVGGNKEA